MRVGITGHQKLRQASDWDWAQTEMRAVLDKCGAPLIGITSLAAGADQLFAEIVLQNGGTLEAIIPFADYEKTFADHEDLETYRSLLASAATVELLERGDSNEEAYLLAGKRVVDLSELVLALWDGKPAQGLGGTADVVQYARDTRKKIIHLNPTTLEINDYPSSK
jgi:hypothetical protein